MKKLFWIALFSFSLLLTGCSSSNKNQVTIGGKNFSEQDILVEILKQTIEGNSDIKVVPKAFLGGTSVVAAALDKGDLDIYVEYTGTALLHILKEPLETDPDKAYKIVKEGYKAKKNILWLNPLGFNNTYAITMRASQAEQLKIKTISDLVPYAPKFSIASDAEFAERPDGLQGMEKAYNIKFSKASSMDAGLMYGAIQDNQVDTIAAFATDGRIPAFKLKILTDDKHFFPPYQAAPIIRTDTLTKYPQLEGILNKLSGKLTDQEMASLNAQVDLDKKSPKEVAEKWLKTQGIIK